ncbi:MAG: PAS domain-containing protein [Cohaesibacter sp.]|jgi:PAS domain S-box-containing protein|nr:PAS domain-containing protein [Cohaesibacter sp.]
MADRIMLTGNERFFEPHELIVSKTDLKGRITYANRVFTTLAGFAEKELMGQPHSIIRHPDMPRCVFKLLWDTIEQGQEIFAYVINRAKNGDHYWVYAHVSPSWDQEDNLIGYHSNRRVPDRQVVEEHIIPLYQAICEVENAHANRKEGMYAGLKMVTDLLASKNVAYDEFVGSLAKT